jgi:hypothetical protein
MIFSEQEDGMGGWVLKFPRPAKRGGGTDDMLSNIGWCPETKEIADIFVDRESPPISAPRRACASKERNASPGLSSGARPAIGRAITAGVVVSGKSDRTQMKKGRLQNAKRTPLSIKPTGA